MTPTNLTHKQTISNPISYDVYFSQNVSQVVDNVLNRNFCDMTIQPYRKWMQYFYATVNWIKEIDQWFSLLTYGYITSSVLFDNDQYYHDCPIGSLTYQRLMGDDGKIIILVTSIQFKPYTYQNIQILMENGVFHKSYHLTESQLRNIIKESIRKILNII